MDQFDVKHGNKFSWSLKVGNAIKENCSVGLRSEGKKKKKNRFSRSVAREETLIIKGYKNNGETSA